MTARSTATGDGIPARPGGGAAPRPVLPAISLAIAFAVMIGGCRVPVLYRTDVEPAGNGTLSLDDGSGVADPVTGEVARLTWPVRAAVYHASRAPGGREALDIGIVCQIRDDTRPADDASAYLTFRVVRNPDDLGIESLDVHTVALLLSPRRDRSELYRFRRMEEPVLLGGATGEKDKQLRGRFVFLLADVAALPGGDTKPMRVELQFTAEADLDLLRRMKLGNDRFVRRLEDNRLARTAVQSEDLDVGPLPEIRGGEPR